MQSLKVAYGLAWCLVLCTIATAWKQGRTVSISQGRQKESMEPTALQLKESKPCNYM